MATTHDVQYIGTKIIVSKASASIFTYACVMHANDVVAELAMYGMITELRPVATRRSCMRVTEFESFCPHAAEFHIRQKELTSKAAKFFRFAGESEVIDVGN